MPGRARVVKLTLSLSLSLYFPLFHLYTQYLGFIVSLHAYAEPVAPFRPVNSRAKYSAESLVYAGRGYTPARHVGTASFIARFKCTGRRRRRAHLTRVDVVSDRRIPVRRDDRVLRRVPASKNPKFAAGTPVIELAPRARPVECR